MEFKDKLKSVLRSTRFFDEYRVIRDSIKTIRKFNLSGSYSLYWKIRSCHRKFGWSPDEYFLYKYETLTHDERRDFVTEAAHFKFAESVNSTSSIQILSDKWKTFEFYNNFFRREARLVTPTIMGGGITV